MQARFNHARRGCAAFVMFAGMSMGVLLPASAAEPVRVDLPPPDLAPAQWSQVKDRPVNEIGAPIDVGRLAGMRGGQDEPEGGRILIDGSVDGNTADRIVSGANTIAGGAFDNASGINTVIQNTGSNVLIQNAMVVTVNFADPIP